MDDLQFPHKVKRGVDDAILTLLNLISSHLDYPGTTTHVISVDFSSTFNI